MARVVAETSPALISEIGEHRASNKQRGTVSASPRTNSSPWKHYISKSTMSTSSGHDPDSGEEEGWLIRSNLPLTRVPQEKEVCCCTKLGRRKRQEDRLLVCPQIKERQDIGFYGVFDGTVGDDASEFVQQHILKQLIKQEEFEAILEMSKPEFTSSKARSLIQTALNKAYLDTDKRLLEHCSQHGLDYASSTSVTAVLTGSLLTIGSLGDSRIAIGKEKRGSLVGEFLTRDHKPDQPHELKRISSNGGSLVYLHSGKPFLRGGDFSYRQQCGDRPMQLNYSRAFGGKDLKCYGLSANPDITQLTLTDTDRVLILASDGLWDVSDADTAVRMAWHSKINGRNPSEDLTDFALKQHDYRGSIDNVTVVVLFL